IGRGDTLFGWGPHNGDIFEQTHQTMNAAAATADADERHAGYDQVQATVVDEAVEFVLYWPDNLGAWRDDISGYVPPIDDVIDASEIAKG
ncbi:MAG: hypothetical protein OXG85_05000, partial [Chloroflexi bacterium]|nr:hypothetical protein [Chloroflexota bacterium]